MKNKYSIISQLRYIVVILIFNSFCCVNAQDVRRVVVSSGSEDIADELFDDGKYFEAISYYEQAKEESKKRKNASLNYNLAECYRRSRHYEEAEVLYALVAKEANDSYPLALFWKAMMEKSNENYKKAASTFSSFSSKYHGKEKKYLEKARLEVEECAKANRTKQKRNFKVEPLKTTVNKEFSNNGAFLQGDTLWFSGTVSNIAYKEKMNLVQGKGKYDDYYFSRIYTSKRETGGNWSEREIIDIKLDDKYADIASPTLSPNGNDLFFTVRTIEDGKDKYKIYRIILNNNKKSKPELLPAPINEEDNSSKDPYIAKIEKDNVLFFTSDRRGKGGFDIFYSKIDDFGNYTKPKNLGDKINTRTHEHSPFYDIVTETLYYSTKGKSGYGGYDIFKTKGNPKDGWEDPVNYGYPVNSGADDYFYIHRINPDDSFQAYISSNRKDANVAENTYCDNIYQFDFRIEDDPVLIVLHCSVFDKEKSEKLNNVRFKLIKRINKKVVEEKDSKDENQAYFSAYKDTSYIVMASKEGYDTIIMPINTSDVEEGDTLMTEGIFLAKTEKVEVIAYVEPEIIEVEPSGFEFPIIYYGFNESNLQPTEREKLDGLAKHLKEERTDIIIYVASHTDNIDTKRSNIKLSKTRSEIVISYLKRKGVSIKRLIGQWYGEDSPIVDNQAESGMDNPDARAKNRRTEFGIITDLAAFQKGQMVAFAKELKLSNKAQNASGLMDDATLRKVLEKYGDMSKPDLIFRVQVGAYRNADANLKAKMVVYAKLQEQVETLLQREVETGYTKFIIGRVSTLNEANNIKKIARKIGIRSSFIAPYYKGKRIRIVDAIEVLAQ